MSAKKIRTITQYAEAKSLAEACGAGALVCMREVFDGRMQTVIKTRGGAVQAVVGARAEMFFSPVFESRGNGDGLFPGFHQTTS